MEGVQVLRDGIGRDVLVVVDAGEEVRLGLLEQGQLRGELGGLQRGDGDDAELLGLGVAGIQILPVLLRDGEGSA